MEGRVPLYLPFSQNDDFSFYNFPRIAPLSQPTFRGASEVCRACLNLLLGNRLLGGNHTHLGLGKQGQNRCPFFRKVR